MSQKVTYTGAVLFAEPITIEAFFVDAETDGDRALPIFNEDAIDLLPVDEAGEQDWRYLPPGSLIAGFAPSALAGDGWAGGDWEVETIPLLNRAEELNTTVAGEVAYRRYDYDDYGPEGGVLYFVSNGTEPGELNCWRNEPYLEVTVTDLMRMFDLDRTTVYETTHPTPLGSDEAPDLEPGTRVQIPTAHGPRNSPTYGTVVGPDPDNPGHTKIALDRPVGGARTYAIENADVSPIASGPPHTPTPAPSTVSDAQYLAERTAEPGQTPRR